MMNKLNKERKRRNNDQSNEQWCVIYSICSSRKMRRSPLHENIVYGYYCFPLKIIVHDYRKSRLLNTELSNCGNIFPNVKNILKKMRLMVTHWPPLKNYRLI